MRKPTHKTCKYCGKEFDVLDPRTAYCGHSCHAKATVLGRKTSAAVKAKISASMKVHWKDHPEKLKRGIEVSLRIGKTTKGKYNPNPESLMELSKRTRTKVFQRMKLGCSRCGWKEAVCDLHHINGRKGPDAHSHSNLSMLCPNCHRLADRGKIKELLIPLTSSIGDKWKEYYFG